MELVLTVLYVLGVIMMIKNFIHIISGRISENDIELLKYVFDKFFIGAILMILPFILKFIAKLRLIEKLIADSKMPLTEEVFCMIIIIGSCVIILLNDYVDYRKSRKSVFQEEQE